MVLKFFPSFLSFFFFWWEACCVCHTATYIRVWERLRTFSLLYTSASVIAVGEDLFSGRHVGGLCLWGWTLRHKLLMVENPRPGFDTWDFSNLQNHHSHSGDWSCGKQVRGFATLELWHLVWMSKEPGNAYKSSFSPHSFTVPWFLRALGTWWLLDSLLSWM